MSAPEMEPPPSPSPQRLAWSRSTSRRRRPPRPWFGRCRAGAFALFTQQASRRVRWQGPACSTSSAFSTCSTERTILPVLSPTCAVFWPRGGSPYLPSSSRSAPWWRTGRRSGGRGAPCACRGRLCCRGSSSRPRPPWSTPPPSNQQVSARWPSHRCRTCARATACQGSSRSETPCLSSNQFPEVARARPCEAAGIVVKEACRACPRETTLIRRRAVVCGALRACACLADCVKERGAKLLARTQGFPTLARTHIREHRQSLSGRQGRGQGCSSRPRRHVPSPRPEKRKKRI
mmetsp:Transcript_17736/g.66972  ORF Transcript_17736/g.66972 Transcript_17736/m.66972 type:complete len:291 (+) Transcript_17736:983-1855(+)